MFKKYSRTKISIIKNFLGSTKFGDAVPNAPRGYRPSYFGYKSDPTDVSCHKNVSFYKYYLRARAHF